MLITVTARLVRSHGEGEIPLPGSGRIEYWPASHGTYEGALRGRDAVASKITEGVAEPVELTPGPWRVMVRPDHGLAWESWLIELEPGMPESVDLVDLAPVVVIDGEKWAAGPAGPSAYDVAVAGGFEGTEAEWLASLRGEDGHTPTFVWDGTALSIDGGEPVDLKGDPGEGGIAGAVPIFETLAEAQAWEAANPGRVALTIESQESDTVPPTPGSLSITPEGTYANALVAGADDDRGTVFYSFRLGSGAWSEWQTEPRYKFSGLTVLTSYTASHRVQDIGSNVVMGAQVPFETLASDTWGTLWSDAMASHPDGSLTGEAWSNAPGTVVWQDGLRPYSTSDSNPPTEGVSVAGGVAVRSGDVALPGPGSFVELPSVPTRVLISITSIANTTRNMPLPVVGGADDVNWTLINTTGQPSVYKTIAHSLWRGSYGAHDVGAKETASFIGTATDGWNLHTFSWDINTSTRVVDFRQDSELKFTYTIPESVWTGGTRYGFWMGSFPEGGWMTDFSIRWE